MELGSFLDRLHHFLSLLGQFIVSLFRCDFLGRGCELLLDLGNDRIFFGGNQGGSILHISELLLGLFSPQLGLHFVLESLF